MKSLFRFLLLTLLVAGLHAAPAAAQVFQPKADKKLSVAPTWFVTDVNGFQLIFADREGRIENLKDLKAQDPSYDPDIVVVLDTKWNEQWRVAENLSESQSGDTSAAPTQSPSVIRRKLSEVIEYKRTGRN